MKQATFCLSELLQPVLFLFRSCLCFLVESGVSLGEEAPVATIHRGALWSQGACQVGPLMPMC